MALFSGSGRLVMSGNDQQASDLIFEDDAELVVDGGQRVAVERLLRSDGRRVLDIVGPVDLIVAGIIGAVRVAGGVRINISDVVGDLFFDGGEGVDVRGVVGAVDVIGAENVTLQSRGRVTFDGGNNCRLDVDGTVLVMGGADMRIALRSVEEDRPLQLNGCVRVDADVATVKSEQHGVMLNNTLDVSVRGSVEESGQGVGTYDNVHITGESEAVRVTALRSRGGNSANAGVFIDEGCTDCIVDGVDFGAAGDYGTDDLVDNGTNTRIGTNWSL